MMMSRSSTSIKSSQQQHQQYENNTTTVVGHHHHQQRRLRVRIEARCMLFALSTCLVVMQQSLVYLQHRSTTTSTTTTTTRSSSSPETSSSYNNLLEAAAAAAAAAPPEYSDSPILTTTTTTVRPLQDNAVVRVAGQAESRTYNDNNNNNIINESNSIDEDRGIRLPKWITDYMTWHQEMRARYPGSTLFTDPSAPNILIRMCLGLCGGLHDRLGQLPWDLYLANQTRRILLIRWERPKPLEEFLIPNELDWSVPNHGVDGFGDMHAIRRLYPDLFRDYSADRPEQDFWDTHLDLALERVKVGEFHTTKALRYQLLGHLGEDVLEKRLRDLGETDMIHDSPSFGKIFHTFFRPSRNVQATLNGVYRELNLSPGTYIAVHCRVRHPKAFPKHIYVKGKNPEYPADKTGLPWYGATRDFAIAIATRALQCAQTLLLLNDEPIYFFSDSNDLVRYISRELQDPTFLAGNSSLFEQSKVDRDALSVVQNLHVVARDTTIENAHIDRQKGRDPAAYYATFVDLYLAIHARCITYGVGYYAVFAAKISGIPCKLLYQEEAWGGDGNKKFQANVCPKKLLLSKLLPTSSSSSSSSSR